MFRPMIMQRVQRANRRPDGSESVSSADGNAYIVGEIGAGGSRITSPGFKTRTFGRFRKMARINLSNSNVDGAPLEGESAHDDASPDDRKGVSRMMSMQGASQFASFNKVARQQLARRESSERTERNRKGVIDPKSPVKITWDLATGVLIVFSVVLIPYQMSFQYHEVWRQKVPIEEEIVSLCVDFIFFVDIILSFFTGYYEFGSNHLVTDKCAIAKQYVKKWFVPDVLSTLPVSNTLLIPPGLAQNLGGLKMVRVIRLFRLLKLMRLIQLMRKTKAEGGQEQNSFKSLFAVVSLFIKIIFIAHLLACMWFLVKEDCKMIPPDEWTEGDWSGCGGFRVPDRKFANYEGDYTRSLEYQQRKEMSMEELVKRGWEPDYDPERLRKSQISMYITSYYWTIATMMAVGYGDIAASTRWERIYAMAVQLIGAVSFGFIISTVSESLEAANPEDRMRKKKLDEVREWTKMRHMTKKFRGTILRHFDYVLSKRSIYNEEEVLRLLPHTLRQRILNMGAMHQRIFKDFIPHLGTLADDAEFTADLALLIRPFKIAPGDKLIQINDYAEQIYVLNSGKLQCTVLNKKMSHVVWALFSSHAMLGLNEVLNDEKYDYAVSVLSPTEMWMLEADNFHKLANGRADVLSHFEAKAAMFQKRKREVIRLEESEHDGIAHYQQVVQNNQLVKYADLHRHVAHTTVSIADSAKKPLGTGNQNATAKRRGTVAYALNAGIAGINQAAKFVRFDSEFDATLEEEDTKVVGERHIELLHSLRLAPIHELDGEDDEILSIKPWNDKVSIVEGYEPPNEMLKRYVIPPHLPLKIGWDLFCGIAIFLSVLLVPFVIGFRHGEKNPPIGFKIIDWIMIFIFATDMILSFFTAFEDEKGCTVTISSMIRSHYLRGWFTIDFVSTFPFDSAVEGILRLSMGTQNSDGQTQLKLFRLFRALRFIRLVKLARLLRFAKILDEVQKTYPDFNPKIFKYMTLMGTFLLAAHFFGCFWNLFHEVPMDGMSGKEGKYSGKQYLSSIYWAITTMTTVGYGEITPLGPDKESNIDREDDGRLYAILIMLIGATVFGHVVGSTAAGSFEGVSQEKRRKEALGRVREYMDEQSIVPSLKQNIRSFMKFWFQREGLYDEKEFMLAMPAFMRNKLHHDSIRKYLIDLKFLAHKNQSYTAIVASRMHLQMFSDGETVFLPYEAPDKIFFQVKGFLYYTKQFSNPHPDFPEEMYGVDEMPGSWVPPGCILGLEKIMGIQHLGLCVSSKAFLYYMSYEAIRSLSLLHRKIAKEMLKDIAVEFEKLNLFMYHKKAIMSPPEDEEASPAPSPDKSASEAPTKPVVGAPSETSDLEKGVVAASGNRDHEEDGEETDDDESVTSEIKPTVVNSIGFDLQYKKFLYTNLHIVPQSTNFQLIVEKTRGKRLSATKKAFMKKSPLKQGLGGLKGLLAAARQKEVLSPLVTLLLEKLEKALLVERGATSERGILEFLPKGAERQIEHRSSTIKKIPSMKDSASGERLSVLNSLPDIGEEVEPTSPTAQHSTTLMKDLSKSKLNDLNKFSVERTNSIVRLEALFSEDTGYDVQQNGDKPRAEDESKIGMPSDLLAVSKTDGIVNQMNSPAALGKRSLPPLRTAAAALAPLPEVAGISESKGNGADDTDE